LCWCITGDDDAPAQLSVCEKTDTEHFGGDGKKFKTTNFEGISSFIGALAAKLKQVNQVEVD
jgi:hypothetical protein